MNKIDGFTLIEIVIVLIVIGIIAVYPLLKWPGTVVNLDAQAESLASDIRYAQSLAMTKGQRYKFLKVSSTTYQVATTGGTAVILGRGSTTATLNSGITFGTLVNVPNSLIAFDGEGTPYTDNGSPPTALSSAAHIPITDGTNTKTIVISPDTGGITIQ